MKSGRQNSKPPKIPEFLLKYMFPDNDCYTTVCDIEEDYKYLLSEKGKYFANLWYWLQLFLALPHFFKQKIYWSTTMFKNYVLIAIRNLKKNRLHTYINILGLSIAFGCFLLIFSFIRYEYTFDKFHENADDIFELYTKAYFDEDPIWTGTQAPIGPILTSQFPEIKSAARVTTENLVVKYKDRIFTEASISTDPEFFDIFTFPLKTGNFDKTIMDINSVILSPNTAIKYFGTEDPVGKIISIKLKNEFKDFTVTGIMEKIPENSSLKPNLIINIKAVYGKELDEWNRWSGPAVFVCLDHKRQAKELEQKFQTTINKHLQKKGLTEKSAYLLAPMADYHLNGIFSAVLRSQSKSIYSYILSGIAALVLTIAICNFVNLSIGGATPRLKEIGLRKLLGAQRKQLIKQFWFETIILSFLAISIGILLAVLFLPTFNVLSQKSLFLDYLVNWKYLTGLISVVLFVGIIAGSYPAIILSKFETVDLFRKVIRFTGKNSFSRVIIVFQFVISIFFISSTIIIFNQYNFMLNEKFGIDSDQVIVLNLASDSSDPVRNRAILTGLKNNLLHENSILSLSASFSKYDRYSATFVENQNNEKCILGLNNIDFEYLPFFGIKLLEGRYFSKDHPSDAGGSVIVNKTFLEKFNVDSPIGKKLSEIFKIIRDDGEIIGVVEDFHYSSLHNQIWPTYLKISTNSGHKYIYIKIKDDNIQDTITLIKNEFNKIAPDMPFLYTFMDEEIAKKYENEKRYGSLFSFISFFAILIACSGLFGLTSLAITRRTKEISIRKVLGASISTIMKSISKEFLLLVILGNIFAWPCAYIASKTWLQNFAYQIKIGPSPFIIAGIITLLIAFLTISIKSSKAAATNPVDSLRYD
jgi:putative ABC transport system permease protein